MASSSESGSSTRLSRGMLMSPWRARHSHPAHSRSSQAGCRLPAPPPARARKQGARSFAPIPAAILARPDAVLAGREDAARIEHVLDGLIQAAQGMVVVV